MTDSVAKSQSTPLDCVCLILTQSSMMSSSCMEATDAVSSYSICIGEFRVISREIILMLQVLPLHHWEMA